MCAYKCHALTNASVHSLLHGIAMLWNKHAEAYTYYTHYQLYLLGWLRLYIIQDLCMFILYKYTWMGTYITQGTYYIYMKLLGTSCVRRGMNCFWSCKGFWMVGWVSVVTGGDGWKVLSFEECIHISPQPLETRVWHQKLVTTTTEQVNNNKNKEQQKCCEDLIETSI
jgi:hypothetical protein